MFPQTSRNQAENGGGGNRTRVVVPQEPRLYWASRGWQNLAELHRLHVVTNALKERDGDRCFYCEGWDSYYVLDHVQPRARGGSDHIENLVLACDLCNDEKNTWPAWIYALRETGLCERVRAKRALNRALERLAREEARVAALSTGRSR